MWSRFWSNLKISSDRTLACEVSCLDGLDVKDENPNIWFTNDHWEELRNLVTPIVVDYIEKRCHVEKTNKLLRTLEPQLLTGENIKVAFVLKEKEYSRQYCLVPARPSTGTKLKDRNFRAHKICKDNIIISVCQLTSKCSHRQLLEAVSSQNSVQTQISHYFEQTTARADQRPVLRKIATKKKKKENPARPDIRAALLRVGVSGSNPESAVTPRNLPERNDFNDNLVLTETNIPSITKTPLETLEIEAESHAIREYVEPILETNPIIQPEPQEVKPSIEPKLEPESTVICDCVSPKLEPEQPAVETKLESDFEAQQQTYCERDQNSEQSYSELNSGHLSKEETSDTSELSDFEQESDHYSGNEEASQGISEFSRSHDNVSTGFSLKPRKIVRPFSLTQPSYTPDSSKDLFEDSISSKSEEMGLCVNTTRRIESPTFGRTSFSNSLPLRESNNSNSRSPTYEVHNSVASSSYTNIRNSQDNQTKSKKQKRKISKKLELRSTADIKCKNESGSSRTDLEKPVSKMSQNSDIRAYFQSSQAHFGSSSFKPRTSTSLKEDADSQESESSSRKRRWKKTFKESHAFTNDYSNSEKSDNDSGSQNSVKTTNKKNKEENESSNDSSFKKSMKLLSDSELSKTSSNKISEKKTSNKKSPTLIFDGKNFVKSVSDKISTSKELKSKSKKKETETRSDELKKLTQSIPLKAVDFCDSQDNISTFNSIQEELNSQKNIKTGSDSEGNNINFGKLQETTKTKSICSDSSSKKSEYPELKFRNSSSGRTLKLIDDSQVNKFPSTNIQQKKSAFRDFSSKKSVKLGCDSQSKKSVKSVRNSQESGNSPKKYPARKVSKDLVNSSSGASSSQKSVKSSSDSQVSRLTKNIEEKRTSDETLFDDSCSEKSVELGCSFDNSGSSKNCVSKCKSPSVCERRNSPRKHNQKQQAFEKISKSKQEVGIGKRSSPLKDKSKCELSERKTYCKEKQKTETAASRKRKLPETKKEALKRQIKSIQLQAVNDLEEEKKPSLNRRKGKSKRVRRVSSPGIINQTIDLHFTSNQSNDLRNCSIETSKSQPIASRKSSLLCSGDEDALPNIEDISTIATALVERTNRAKITTPKKSKSHGKISSYFQSTSVFKPIDLIETSTASSFSEGINQRFKNLQNNNLKRKNVVSSSSSQESTKTSLTPKTKFSKQTSDIALQKRKIVCTVSKAVLKNTPFEKFDYKQTKVGSMEFDKVSIPPSAPSGNLNAKAAKHSNSLDEKIRIIFGDSPPRRKTRSNSATNDLATSSTCSKSPTNSSSQFLDSNSDTEYGTDSMALPSTSILTNPDFRTDRSRASKRTVVPSRFNKSSNNEAASTSSCKNPSQSADKPASRQSNRNKLPAPSCSNIRKRKSRAFQMLKTAYDFNDQEIHDNMLPDTDRDTVNFSSRPLESPPHDPDTPPTLQTRIPIPRDVAEHQLSQMTDIYGCQREHFEILIERYLNRLFDIFNGKTKCDRHKQYQAGPRSRRNLTFRIYYGKLTDEQLDTVVELLVALFCKTEHQHATYVFQVIVPEMLIMATMDMTKLSYDEAEEMLRNDVFED